MITTNTITPGSLRAYLAYEPQVLKFGTSGRRGDVVHLTQLEVYINARAELEYLQNLSVSAGGIKPGDPFYFAYDLRPSSSRYVPEEKGRGELAQAVERAIRDAGMQPVNLGRIPTPALTSYAIERGHGSMMITGSHIPFERNGYKTNTAQGELLKKDEGPINHQVEIVRQRLYEERFEASLFNAQGRFKAGSQDLMPETPAAREAYIRRYADFFPPQGLRDLRLLAYQHSAVGRDLLVEILRQLGAEVIPAGRSETFVPIDTENIEPAQLAVIQDLVNEVWQSHGPVDAVVSTDGDSDRPLLLGISRSGDGSVVPGVKPPPGQARFFGGDLVGMIVAEYLQADAVVVPISCNDAIDRGALQQLVEPKTRIGSPQVIAGMEKARHKGRQAVCGWEANGGFLTGSDLVKNRRTLRALPTRDAMLPLLGVLFAMVEKRMSMTELFDRLPKRFSRAALLKKFPRPISQRIMETFSPAEAVIKEVVFDPGALRLLDEDGQALPGTLTHARSLPAMRERLEQYFTPTLGFDPIIRLNYIDGVRIYFKNGDIAHVRPSGNADELRIYAVADTQARADAIAQRGIAEPDGILRSLERAVGM